jgi:hypothetical protein
MLELQSHRFRLIKQDIIIVDTHSDLNVYVTMANEAKAENENAAQSCNPSVAGAASGTLQEAPCCWEKKRSNCCSDQSPTKHGGAAAAWDLADVDINEWAGKFI